MVIEEIYGEVAQLESEPEVNQIGEVPEDVPFTVPKKWKWMPLKNVGRIVGGGTPKTSVTEYWKDGTIVWFTPADLGKVTGVYASDSERKITELGLAKSSAVLMPPNSIIFSSRAPIGYIAVATKHCCTNQGCKSFVPDLKVIDSLWGYFAIRARTPDIIARASGTTFKEISGKEVGETLIPIPPLLEQQRIVKRLIEIQTLIDSYGKEQEALEELEQKLPSELKASLLQEAIRGKLVPQLESEPEMPQIGGIPENIPFDIPSKWKWMSLENVLTEISDGSHNPPPNSGKGVPVLSAKNINNGIIDTQLVTRWTTEEQWAIEDRKIHIEPGDVLLTIVGTIGRTAVVPDDAPKFMLQRSVCVMKTKNFLNSKFLSLMLTSPALLEWMMDRASGTAQKGIYLKALRAMPLPIPPLSEQHRIVGKLTELFNKLNQIDKLK